MRSAQAHTKQKQSDDSLQPDLIKKHSLYAKTATNSIMLTHQEIINNIITGEIQLALNSPFIIKLNQNENERHAFLQTLHNTLLKNNITNFNSFYWILASLPERDRRCIWPTVCVLLLKKIMSIQESNLSSQQQIILARIIYITSTPATYQHYRVDLPVTTHLASIKYMFENNHFTSLCLHTLYNRAFDPTKLYKPSPTTTMKLIGIMSNILMSLNKDSFPLEDIKKQIVTSFSIIRGTKRTSKTVTPAIILNTWSVILLSYIKHLYDELENPVASRNICLLLSRTRLQLAYSTGQMPRTITPTESKKKSTKRARPPQAETPKTNNSASSSEKKARLKPSSNELGVTLAGLNIS